MSSQYTQGVSDDMAETVQDNLETLRGVGTTRDITTHEAYDPQQRVGTENDFSRDLGADGASRSTRHGGSATEDIINALPPIFMVDKQKDKAPGKPPSGCIDDPVYMLTAPAERINTTQVTLGASATRILFYAPERLSAVIVNNDVANSLYIGANSALTSSVGFVIKPGASMTLAVNCELYALSPSGAIVSVIEFLK